MVANYNRKCSRCGLFKPHTKYAGIYGAQFLCQDCKDYLKSQKEVKQREQTDREYKESVTARETIKRNTKILGTEKHTINYYKKNNLGAK